MGDSFKGKIHFFFSFFTFYQTAMQQIFTWYSATGTLHGKRNKIIKDNKIETKKKFRVFLDLFLEHWNPEVQSQLPTLENENQVDFVNDNSQRINGNYNSVAQTPTTTEYIDH